MEKCKENSLEEIMNVLIKEYMEKTGDIDSSVSKVIKYINNLGYNEKVEDNIVKYTILEYNLEKLFMLDFKDLPLCIIIYNNVYTDGDSGTNPDTFRYYSLADDESEKYKEASMLILSIIFLIDPYVKIHSNQINLEIPQSLIRKKLQLDKPIQNEFKKLFNKDLDRSILDQISEEYRTGKLLKEKGKEKRVVFAEYYNTEIYNSTKNSAQGTTIYFKIGFNLSKFN